MHRALLILLVSPLFAAGPVQFAEHQIADGLRGGYQVVVADLNHDGKPDLIALPQQSPDLVWFENPSWERHVIVKGQSQMINCIVVGDEIVLASEFSNIPNRSLGVISVLRPNGDPRNEWRMTEIDRLPTAHRLLLADIDGSGKPVVLLSPLAGATAEPPDYRTETPLVYYRPGEWKRIEITPRNHGIVHGIYVMDWDGDKRDEILTAGFEGIFLFKLGRDGVWARTQLTAGDPAPWPKSGSSDVAVGRLANKQRFLAAIEPWHGNQIAVYTQSGGSWQRNVIEDSYTDGHALLLADLNGTGSDEIIGGYRGRGTSVYIYSPEDAAGAHWVRRTLDAGGMAASSCKAVDLNADRRVDIVCIGSTTANLKWYENLGAARMAAR